jgi:hypothetical protein
MMRRYAVRVGSVGGIELAGRRSAMPLVLFGGREERP